MKWEEQIMKSKSYCFNKTIFKKNLSHFWPLWALYTGYLILVLPVNLWLTMSGYSQWDTYTQVQRQLTALGNTMQLAMNPIMTFVFAALTIMAVFSYLYSPKNANMVHALPVNRLELFVTNFCSALIFMILPQIITFIISVFVCIAAHVTNIEYMLIWFGTTAGVTFFALAFGSFTAMLTGQLLAFPAYYFSLNLLFVGCRFLVNELVSNICFGISANWTTSKLCILSPLYYLFENLKVKTILDEEYIAVGLELQGGCLVGIYAAAGVFFLIAGYQLYKRRQIETAGDMVSIRGTKPIVRLGTGFFFGTLFGDFLTEAMKMRLPSDQANYVLLICLVLLMETICFCAVEMLMLKSFRIFRKRRLAEWAVLLGATVAFLGMLRMDVFGIERKIPELSDVERASINLDYQISFKGDDIQKVIDIQKQILKQKEELISNDDVNYIGISYKLKNGNTINRNYPIPVSAEYLKQEDSIASQVIAMETEPENFMRYLFGKKYETNEYYVGSMQYVTKDGRSSDYRFSDEELEQIMNAIFADIDNGSLCRYELYSLWGFDENSEYTYEKRYYNSFIISFFNPEGVIRGDTQYYNADGLVEDDEDYDYDTSSTAFIEFGPDCTNIITALEKLGVVNEEYPLMTNEEYYSLTDR